MPVKHIDNLVTPTNSSPWCRVITISINKEVLKTVEVQRWKLGISRSELFRRAIRYYLEHEADFNKWCDEQKEEYDSLYANQPETLYYYNGKPIKVIRRLE